MEGVGGAHKTGGFANSQQPAAPSRSAFQDKELSAAAAARRAKASRHIIEAEFHHLLAVTGAFVAGNGP